MKEKCKYGKRSLQFAVYSLHSKILLIVCSLIFAVFIVSCGEEEGQKQETLSSKPETIFYCPMHPDVVQDHPGKCPKPECRGMDLVLKEVNDTLSGVSLPVNSATLSKIRVINPEFRKYPVRLEATGYLDYDINSRTDISSRYSGRIERLYVKYNYKPVKKGDVIFEIYSADLVTAQENLLYLLKNAPDEKTVINAAREKLKLLQLTSEQISAIESSGKILSKIGVQSKYTGIIHEYSGQNMNDRSMNDLQRTSLTNIREGMYVDRGMILFNVVDPLKLVAMLKIKSGEMNTMDQNSSVELIVNNDDNNKLVGKISLIEPVIGSDSRTVMIRVNVENRNAKYKVGSLVNAKILSDSIEALWVPTNAVVDLGRHKIVWVLENNYFKVREVETGIHSGDMIEISDGLTETDKIALEGHYLSDSESFIKTTGNE